MTDSEDEARLVNAFRAAVAHFVRSGGIGEFSVYEAAMLEVVSQLGSDGQLASSSSLLATYGGDNIHGVDSFSRATLRFVDAVTRDKTMSADETIRYIDDEFARVDRDILMSQQRLNGSDKDIAPT